MPFVAFGVALVATVWLWGRNLANPLVMGQAEGPEANVTSPVSGRVARLAVDLYQQVRAGDLVAIVDTSDPQVLSNTVAVIRAEMEAIRTDAGFRVGDRVRLAQLQMDWLSLKSELPSLNAQLQFWEAEYKRLGNLAQDQVESERDLQFAKSEAERLQAEVREKTVEAEATEKALKELAPDNSGNTSKLVQGELAVATERLRLAEAKLQPISLRAPISGRVTKLSVLQEGNVIRGDVVATIASPTVDRIVGYIGQPVRLEPKEGMRVEIRSRGTDRELGQAQIAYVGPRIELFNAPLRVRGMGAAQERGLPIVTTVPPGMKLRPGELVDLRILEN